MGLKSIYAHCNKEEKKTKNGIRILGVGLSLILASSCCLAAQGAAIEQGKCVNKYLTVQTEAGAQRIALNPAVIRALRLPAVSLRIQKHMICVFRFGIIRLNARRKRYEKNNWENCIIVPFGLCGALLRGGFCRTKELWRVGCFVVCIIQLTGRYFDNFRNCYFFGFMCAGPPEGDSETAERAVGSHPCIAEAFHTKRGSGFHKKFR